MTKEERMARIERIKRIAAAKASAATPGQMQTAAPVSTGVTQPSPPATREDPQAPYPYDQEAFGGILNPMNRLRAIGNMPHDTGQIMSALGRAASSPIQSAKTMAKAIGGLPSEVSKMAGESILGTLGGAEELDRYKKWTQENMPNLSVPESAAFLEEMKKSYIDEPGKTTVERPVQTILDVLGLVQPAARGLGGVRAAKAVQRANPLQVGGNVLEKLAGKMPTRKLRQPVTGPRPGLLEELVALPTGKSKREARQLRLMGQRNNPAEIAAFKKAQKMDVSLEPVSDAVESGIKAKQMEMENAFGAAVPKYKTIIGESGIRKLADGLNDIKEGLVEKLRAFNINVKGRAGLADDIAESRLAQQTPREGFRGSKKISAATVAEEKYGQPLSPETLAYAQRKGYVKPGVERTDPFVMPPSVQGKDVSGALDEAFKRTGQQTPAISDAQLEAFHKITNDILIQENPLPENLHALRNRIGDYVDEIKVKQPGTEVDAFATRVLGEFEDLLENTLKGRGDVPPYTDLAKKYGDFRDHRREIAIAFGLDADPPTRIRKLLDVYADNPANEFARRVFESVIDASDEKVISTMLGTNWENALGSGLVARGQVSGAMKELRVGVLGGGAIGALAGGAPGALAGVLLGALGGLADIYITSPKKMSAFLVKLGRNTNPTARGKLAKIGQLTKRIYQEAQKRGIPVDGMTYAEILERMDVKGRAEEQEKLFPFRALGVSPRE